ncbi:MAG: Fic family protein [Bdellovibrionales bacterium]
MIWRSTLTFLVLLFSIPSFASLACFDAYYRGDKKNSSPVEQTYRESRLKMEKLIEKSQDSKKDSEVFVKNFDSLFFVDYQHYVHKIVKALVTGKKFSELDIYKRYDQGREKAFEAFISAFKSAHNTKSELELDLLKRFHSLSMKGGIDGIRPNQLGKLREYEVIGYANAKESSLSREEIRVIEDSIYLTFREIEVRSKRHFGAIEYSHIQKLPVELVRALGERNPRLLEKIDSFLKSENETPDAKLVSETVKSLLQERFQWFLEQRAELKTIKTGKQREAYIELVADFYRDLISIHPFADGNGRTLRVMMSYLFIRENISPPRLFDVSKDILSSRENWIKQVKAGVLSTQKLMADISHRLESNLDPTKSPYLYSVIIPEGVMLKARKSRKNYEKWVDIPATQFVAFLRAQTSTRTDLRKLDSDPLNYMKNMVEEYQALIEKLNVYSHHPKRGWEHISIRLVDEDYIQLYSHQWAGSGNWKTYVDRWFKKNLVWRGLTRFKGNREFSDSEALDMFTQLHTHNSSQRIIYKDVRSPERIRRVAMEDFIRFNRDIINGKIEKMADDHQNAQGDYYGKSYLYSTGNETTGKRFARGFMVVVNENKGDYKEAQYQERLVSRVNVGVYQANHNIALGTMRKVFDKFRTRYPRQQEVINAGSAEPDAVMIIKLYDAKGKVEVTYMRNPENPAEIFKIKGNHSLKSGRPNKSKILTIFKI